MDSMVLESKCPRIVGNACKRLICYSYNGTSDLQLERMNVYFNEVGLTRGWQICDSSSIDSGDPQQICSPRRPR